MGQPSQSITPYGRSARTRQVVSLAVLLVVGAIAIWMTMKLVAERQEDGIHLAVLREGKALLHEAVDRREKPGLYIKDGYEIAVLTEVLDISPQRILASARHVESNTYLVLCERPRGYHAVETGSSELHEAVTFTALGDTMQAEPTTHPR